MASESFILPPAAPPLATARLGLLGGWGPWLRGGKIYDWSDKGADGTLNGTAALSLSRFGQSIYFDGGANSYLDLGTPSHLVGKLVDFTITARLIVTASAWNPIYAAYQTTTGGKLWAMFRVESTSNVLAYYTVAVGGGFSNYAMAAGDAIVLGSAYFVAIAVKGPTSAPAGRFYLNGKYVPFAMSAIGTPDTSVPIYIGGDVYGERFNGKIADIRIYDRELTRTELDAAYAEPWRSTRSGTLLIAMPEFLPRALAITDISAAASPTSVALVQNSSLTTTGAVSAAAPSTLALAQHHEAAVTGLAGLAAPEAMALGQTHQVTVSAPQSAASVVTVALTQTHQLAVAMISALARASTIQLPIGRLVALYNLTVTAWRRLRTVTSAGPRRDIQRYHDGDS